MIPPTEEKGKKHQRLSTVGLSFDLNVSSQGVKDKVSTSHQKEWIFSGFAENDEVVAVEDFIDVGNILGKSWVSLWSLI